MKQRDSQNQQPDVRPVFQLISRTRSLLRLSWVATGAGVAVGLLLSVLVAVCLADLVAPFWWPALRLIALLLVVVPAAIAVIFGVLRPLLRRLSVLAVARRIEQHLPGIHNRLVSCVDLASKRRRPIYYSLAFFRRLVDEAVQRIRGFRPRAVVDVQRLRRASLFAGGALAAFVFALVLFSDRLPTAMARILRPFADIPPASGVLYEVSPGDAKLLRGEPVTIAARVVQGDPQRLWVQIVGKKRLRHELRKQPDDETVWKLTLSGLEQSFDYRVFGGGTWSKSYRITMVDRPRIVELHTVLHLPEYMGIAEPRPSPPQTADVTGPKGSQVDVVVQSGGDVAEGLIQILKPVEPLTESPPPDQPSSGQRRQFAVVARYHMEQIAPEKWSGRFPLTRDGFYRVELRNELGYANKPMKEARFFTIPDNPPQVFVERPGTDLVLSGPVPVPLVVSAQDDFGLASIGLSIRRRDGQQWVGQPIKVYDKPQGSATEVTSLELARMGLKRGDRIQYRLEARDRKGQTARSQEYTIRIASASKAADRELARFEQYEKHFADRLEQLVAEQSKVTEAIRRLHAEYSPAEREQDSDPAGAVAESESAVEPERGEQRQPPSVAAESALPRPQAPSQRPRGSQPPAERQQSSERPEPAAGTQAHPRRPEKTPSAPTPAHQAQRHDQQLTPAEQQQVRRQLARLAPEQQRNLQLGQQVGEQLRRAADQAAELAMMPPQIASQMDKLHRAFQNAALAPMRDLAQRMQQAAAQPAGPAPDLDRLHRQSQRLQRELEAIRDRWQALTEAQQQMGQDLEAALAQLEQAMLQQDAQLTARELAELRDFIAQLREELGRLEGDQEQLLDAAASVPEPLLPQVASRQAGLEQQAQPPLDQTRQLQASQRMQRIRRQLEPMMAGAQSGPEQQAGQQMPAASEQQQAQEAQTAQQASGQQAQSTTPPTDQGQAADQAGRQRESDTRQPDGQQGSMQEHAPSGPNGQQAQPPPFVPALGGPAPQPDPRYTERRRELQQQAEQQAGQQPASDHDRRQLQMRQLDELEQLDLAERSLAADQQVLERMLGQLGEQMAEAGQAEGDRGQPAGEQAEAGAEPAQGAEDASQQASAEHGPAGNAAQPASAERQAAASQSHQHDAQAAPANAAHHASSAQPGTGQQSDQSRRSPPTSTASGQQQQQARPGSGQQQAGQPAAAQPSSATAATSADQLSRLLESPTMQQALAMAARMRQMLGLTQAANGQQQHGRGHRSGRTAASAGPSSGNLTGVVADVTAADAQLRQLDPATRAIILKMQPRIREQLLEGMREQGPEGYRRFIREYFRRLTKAGSKP